MLLSKPLNYENYCFTYFESSSVEIVGFLGCPSEENRRNKTLKLNNCCNEYYEYLKNSKDISKHISTFNMFIHNKTDKIKYDSPKMLMDEVMKLIPPDTEK
jgi:hypothetical protein